jgi:hypothetical protein
MNATAKQKTIPYVPDYDYTTEEGWSMTNAETDKILDRAAKYKEAGNEKASRQELKKIPLAPNLAWKLRDLLGKKDFLAEGYNLKDAEIAYGENWIDTHYVINNNEGKSNGG